jgi:uncharacterized protein
VSGYQPISADGHQVAWRTWDREHTETATIRWENEGFTVNGHVGREDIDYVLRLSPLWQLRQFILFRDLDEPDLWLVTDGSGRWGEMNGAHRPDLDGARDVHMPCSPLALSVPVIRMPLEIGHSAEVPLLTIDVDTLATANVTHRYTRITERRWSHRTGDLGSSPDVEFEVDEHGLVVDYPERFRRAAH